MKSSRSCPSVTHLQPNVPLAAGTPPQDPITFQAQTHEALGGHWEPFQMEAITFIEYIELKCTFLVLQFLLQE